MSKTYIDSFVKNIPLLFTEQPQGFGWAPDRHYRAKVMFEGTSMKVILKRCWNIEAYYIECNVYNKLSPKLQIKLPKLLCNMNIEDEYWLVLEDIGSNNADCNNSVHRIELLKMLGQLHGNGIKFLYEDINNDGILQNFNNRNEEYIKKKNLIEQAIDDKRFSLNKWVVSFYEYLWAEINKQDKTIVHGDTDFSNVIIDDNEFGLIDFEKCKIGPSIIDFSKITEHIKNPDEYSAYVNSFNNESALKITLEQVLHITYLGEIYDVFHWICYDIENTFNPSYPEYEFNKNAFIDKINKLEILYKQK